ncbi:hypothetical protein K469DRAFT_510701, partial [Zopfia rhizophila CBS 207.26]
GTSPVAISDTVDAFKDSTEISAIALSPSTASGYKDMYKNLKTSSNAYGYMGFTSMSSYDTDACASKHNSKIGCMAIILFKRNLTQNIGPACSNPPSATIIKCGSWRGPATPENTVNAGYTDNNSTITIAGSNRYVQDKTPSVPEYDGPSSLGNAAINAPMDCSNSYDTYMGFKIFPDGSFDPALCAAACTATSNYNIAHPPATGEPRTCRSFNAYILLKNGNVEGQYCSLFGMYTRAWDSSHATNSGQYHGSDSYTVQNSVGYKNSTGSSQKC